MGLRVRKSFKVAPGVRINVGRKSAGVSVGCKGLRYSVNSRTGARATASIPGTGISYTTSTRSYSSSAYSRNSELKRLQKQQEKMEELERNKLEVELYENKLDMIKSIHKECDDSVNWIDIASTEPPFKFDEGEKGVNELEAIQKLENYKPSFFSKILKKQEIEINKLKKDVDIAKNKDEEEYKSFVDLNTPIELLYNQNAGENNTHPIDIKLSGGSSHEVDIYKTTIKFEAVQK